MYINVLYYTVHVHCFSDVLHFDNTYSWMRQKEVFYSVHVDEPDTTLRPDGSSSNTSVEPHPSTPRPLLNEGVSGISLEPPSEQ